MLSTVFCFFPDFLEVFPNAHIRLKVTPRYTFCGRNLAPESTYLASNVPTRSKATIELLGFGKKNEDRSVKPNERIRKLDFHRRRPFQEQFIISTVAY